MEEAIRCGKVEQSRTSPRVTHLARWDNRLTGKRRTPTTNRGQPTWYPCDVSLSLEKCFHSIVAVVDAVAVEN
ncbi:unnamed protein product [Ectocarpus fasciculatus]